MLAFIRTSISITVGIVVACLTILGIMSNEKFIEWYMQKTFAALANCQLIPDEDE